MIYNRFIHNIFLFLDKGKENTFKIYSISNKDKTEKNVEVIKLNPIFIVWLIFLIFFLIIGPYSKKNFKRKKYFWKSQRNEFNCYRKKAYKYF